MEIKGKIKRIGEVKQVTEKLTKRELVLVTDEKYPQILLFQLLNDKCKLADNLQVNQEVNIHFNLDGREWTNKNNEILVFNSLTIWKIDTNFDKAVENVVETKDNEPMEMDDDLPF